MRFFQGDPSSCPPGRRSISHLPWFLLTVHRLFRPPARSWASRSGWGWRAREDRASRTGRRRRRWTTGGPRWPTQVRREPAPLKCRRAGASTTEPASDLHSALRASRAPPPMVRHPDCPDRVSTLEFYFVSIWSRIRIRQEKLVRRLNQRLSRIGQGLLRCVISHHG